MAIQIPQRWKNMDRRKTSALGVLALTLLLVLVFCLRMNNIEMKFLPGDIEAVYRTFEKLEIALNDGSFDGMNGLFDDRAYSEQSTEFAEAPMTPITTEAPTTPITTEATTKPKTTQATTKPKTTRVTTKPKTTRVTTKPKTTQATTKPKTTQATTKPTTTKATTKPTTTKATTKPTTQRRTVLPSRLGPKVGLILTPFLNNGYDDYARQRALVNLTEFPRVRSYAGYFTVQPNYDSNLFFWYFPATAGKAHALRTFQKARSADAPVVLFLEGMLGMSSLCSIFLKNGPFELGANGKPRERPDSLNSKHNIIYIDSPVGAGYSYIKSDRVFPTPIQISDGVYEAIRQFFEMFPNLRRNKFFVAGESMAGQFVPLVTWRIHDRNQRLPADKRINLKGMAIGNGWVDPMNQLIWGENLYNLGLVDEREREELRRLEKQAQDYINNGYDREATSVIQKLVWDRNSLFKSLTGYQRFFNFLDVSDKLISLDFVKWITSEKVRSALHVGANHFEPMSRNVQNHLRYDMIRSVAYISSIILRDYQVLIYTGELDMFCSYLSVQNWLGKLNWSGAMHFRNTRKDKWLEDGYLVGYTRKHGNLIEVLVRNAGHFSSIDQPERTRKLLEHFTHGEEF